MSAVLTIAMAAAAAAAGAWIGVAAARWCGLAGEVELDEPACERCEPGLEIPPGGSLILLHRDGAVEIIAALTEREADVLRRALDRTGHQDHPGEPGPAGPRGER